MRNFLYTVGLATVILLNAAVVRASNDVYYTNLNNIEMTEQEYNNLLNLGFSDIQIARMNEDEFLNNKDIESELVSTEKKYVKTTTTLINGIKYTTSEVLGEEELEEALLQVQQPTYSPNMSGNYYDGYSYTEIIELTTQMSYIDNATIRFRFDVEWEEMPNERYYDIMGIGFDQTKVNIVSDIFFREDWTTSNNTAGYELEFYPKEESTGGSVLYELPSGSLNTLSAYMYFDVGKKSGAGTLTYVEAVGDYAHADVYYNPEATNGVRQNYTVNIGGVDVDSPYGSHYYSLPAAVAHFSGTW